MSLLQLEHIHKTYSQGTIDVPALSDINLVIEQGEYVAIMGPSGSGKSTLMNIIGCLDKPTEGKIYLNGNDIGAMNDRKLSDIRNKEIGFVFQNFNLMPRQSALQNVELPLQYAHVPRKLRRVRCEEALVKVGLEDRMSFKATQLSGGQKQRVAIARAIVNQPSILLADEPTGALDSKSGIQVMSIFKQLHSEGSTIIMITHAEEIARYAKRIIKIFDGEITSDYINPAYEEANEALRAFMIQAEAAKEAENTAENADENIAENVPTDADAKDNTIDNTIDNAIDNTFVNAADKVEDNVENNYVDNAVDITTDNGIDIVVDENIDTDIDEDFDFNLRDTINNENVTYASNEAMNEFENDIELSEGGVTA